MNEARRIVLALTRTWVWLVGIGCFVLLAFMDISAYGWFHFTLNRETGQTRLIFMAISFGCWVILAGPVVLFRYFYTREDSKSSRE